MIFLKYILIDLWVCVCVCVCFRDAWRWCRRDSWWENGVVVSTHWVSADDWRITVSYSAGLSFSGLLSRPPPCIEFRHPRLSLPHCQVIKEKVSSAFARYSPRIGGFFGTCFTRAWYGKFRSIRQTYFGCRNRTMIQSNRRWKLRRPDGCWTSWWIESHLIQIKALIALSLLGFFTRAWYGKFWKTPSRPSRLKMMRMNIGNGAIIKPSDRNRQPNSWTKFIPIADERGAPCRSPSLIDK